MSKTPITQAVDFQPGADSDHVTVQPPSRLRTALLVGDAAAIAIGLALAIPLAFSHVHGFGRTALAIAVGTALGLWCVRFQGLFLARISVVRVVEWSRCSRAVVMLGVTGYFIGRTAHLDASIGAYVVAGVVVLGALLTWRTGYRAWVRSERSRGRHMRSMVVIGTGEEAAGLIRLIQSNREYGFVVSGVVGSRSDAERLGIAELWRGTLGEASAVIDQLGASGAVLVPSCVPSVTLNRLVRELQDTGTHLHLSMGIHGIDVRRLRTVPIAYEPLLYVEAPNLSRLQTLTKRVFDLVVATVALVVLSPLFLAVALAIRLGDGGPVFFRQMRVGRDGRQFGVLKFRSMRVDAEAMVAELAAQNERSGPLFKMVNDPRVTRVGRLLRDTSIDELPQLWNVLCGQMSLVGPRPALPKEVAQFSDELRRREQVPPGITGLWQVEARDNPSFEAYFRYDVFYVENWSIVLDLMILVGTVEQIAAKLWSITRRRQSDDQVYEEAVKASSAAA